MNTKQVKNAAQILRDPVEGINDEIFRPILDEAKREVLDFFPSTLVAKNTREIAHGELAQAREQKKLQQKNAQDQAESEEKALHIREQLHMIQMEYRKSDTIEAKNVQEITVQVDELKTEIAQLSKLAGVNTKAHLENTTKKAGLMDIKRLTNIVKTLKARAEEVKNANELQAQAPAKQTSGMMAWVSGKQMKIHEQGTLTLQG